MTIHYLDTSAILNGCLDLFENIYISPLVVAELENIKTSSTDLHTKYLARQAVRDILMSKSILTIPLSQKKVDKLLKKYEFLSNINDHRMLCEAIILNDSYEVCFVTSDGTQYIFAQELKLNSIYYATEDLDNENENYCGWSRHYPNEEQMAQLYSDPQINTLNLKINEFAEIFEGTELKDILFWNGERYRPLNYKPLKNRFLNETISPRNLEQKMAFDLLENQDIKVKLLTSAWGSGKSLLALSYALDQVGKGNYSKMIFIRNNIIVADTNDIGYMPGDTRSKLSIWCGILADHLGSQEMLDQLMDDGIIEAIPLSHIRGRSLKNSVVVCDECEDLNDKLVTLLLSRIEENSEIIFCGDVAQIDNKRFEKNNGIHAMIRSLAGDPLFGMVKLIKSERGPVPKLCDKIRPPI